MYSDQINRSYSESDIYISQFDNLSVSSPRNFFKKPLENSCSSVIRRIYIEEIVSPGSKTFGSTDGVFGSTRKSCSYSEIDNLCSPSYKRREEDIYEVNIKTEPMDIDTSYSDERFPSMICQEKPRFRRNKIQNIHQDELDSTVFLKSELNVSRPITVEDDDKEESDTNTEITESLSQPPKIRVMHITHTRKKSNMFRWIMVLIILGAIAFFYGSNKISFGNSDIQIDQIQRDLERNVLGHLKIVDNFIHILKGRENWAEKLKVISFVGSQGVGKTYFASLIKKHFQPHLAHEVYGAHLYYRLKRQEIIDSINSCCLNLIVIDDLKNSESPELFELAYSLPKDSFILLIAIYNTHYTDKTLNKVAKYEDVIKIRNSFDNSAIRNYELFVFKDLTSDEVKDWLQKELISKNISSSQSEEIVETVLGNHDMKSGLKGLRSKLLLELQKYAK